MLLLLLVDLHNLNMVHKKEGLNIVSVMLLTMMPTSSTSDSLEQLTIGTFQQLQRVKETWTYKIDLGDCLWGTP